MGFLRKKFLKLRVKNIQEFNRWLETLSKEEIVKSFIFTVWTRAIALHNGYFKLPDGTPHRMTSLVNLPFLFTEFTKIQKHFSKDGRNYHSEFFSAWIFTIQAFIYGGELEQETNKMWGIIAKTKYMWADELKNARDQDIEKSPNEIKDIYKLAQEIISKIPPEKV